MRMIHGSVQNVLASENGSFDVFDYKIGNDGKPNNQYVDNGNDAQGPGIYAWPGNDENYAQGLKSAACYTGKDSGYVYVLNVDVEEEDLLNNLEPDLISKEEWVSVIEEFIRLTHVDAGFNLENYNDIVSDIESRIEDGENVPSFEELEALFEGSGLSLDQEYNDPKTAEDSWEWADSIRNEIEISDPCSKINENGGPEGVSEYAMNKSNNLWDTLTSVWSSIATEHTGLGINTYNKRFLTSVQNTVGKERDLTAALVNDGDFYVIFNPEAITIEKIIDVSPQIESEYSEGATL